MSHIPKVVGRRQITKEGLGHLIDDIRANEKKKGRNTQEHQVKAIRRRGSTMRLEKAWKERDKGG